MTSFTDDGARDAAITAACGDPSSDFYKKLCRMLNDAVAMSQQSRERAKHVTVPFPVQDHHVVALEAQFSVQIRVKKGFIRSRNTERVAALQCVLDAALMEHAGSDGRSTLFVDGDVMYMVATGLEGRIVERSNCHARAAAGYFEEDQCLGRLRHSSKTGLVVNALNVLEEQLQGGGEHFSPHVREDGPRVDSVIFNNFKTPVGVGQAAWLTHLRGGVGYGAIPFQVDMRYRLKGRLQCFPGWFYIDKEADMITLVPDDDATMSISHPYSSLMSFIDNNVVSVAGREFLCEKYNKVPGILYYSLTPVDGEYHQVETLRSYFYDVEAARTSIVRYPKVRLSEEGVPIGFEVGEIPVLTSRLNTVIEKVAISRNEIVTPAEVRVALINENNMVLNTMDTAVLPERMDEFEQQELAVAIALHVNWRRHAARSSFNTLLTAMKLRHATAERSVLGMAVLALSAWWQRPRVDGETHDTVPCPKVADWCGNDFSVVIKDVEPWLEIVQQTAAPVDNGRSRIFGLPQVPKSKPRVVVQKEENKKQKKEKSGFLKLLKVPQRSSTCAAVLSTGNEHDDADDGKPVLVTTGASPAFIESYELSDIKRRLRAKMVTEQHAVNEQASYSDIVRPVLGIPEQVPVVPVVPVDPVSSIRNDLDEIYGGLPERDAARTGYQLTEVEDDRRTTGNLGINDAKRVIPKGQYIRRAKVDAGVEGKRKASSMALCGALYKRNLGIPNNQGAVDLDLTPDANVQRVINTCFRDDWQAILNRHLETGLWEANEPDIDRFLANLNETKVERMLDEFFCEGFVSLDRWHLMAKGKIKPSREIGADAKVDHSQTIMFLDSLNTNGMYSAMTRRFKLCLDELLLDNVKLNAQWSVDESEDWFNSLEPVRRSCGSTYCYNVDSTAFDRSQGHPALLTEMAFYRRMGLDRQRYQIWIQTHGKKTAMAMAYGIIMFAVLTGVSGLWKTLLRNGLIQLTATVVSTNLRRDDVVSIEVKGDDVDMEVKRPLKVETAVQRMSLSFNLASKFNTSSVRYFCKRFRIKVMGRWLEIEDPWSRVQSVCAPINIDDQTSPSLTEKWISLRADLRHYDNEIAITAVAEAAMVFYGLKKPLYGMARALATLARDKTAFINFYSAPELIY